MPLEIKPTWKMGRRKIKEDRIDKLEKRRKLSEYRLAEGERKFHLWLSSERLGLTGKLDLLIESPQGLFPVDFKLTTGQPYKNHVFQLCGYALLVEDHYRKPVDKGFVYLIPKDDAVVFDLTPELKETTLQVLAEIRSMIEEEETPPPTPLRNRCADCEYRNFCGDVF
jgi:CRISPR-associated exonuclease Cas4